MPEIVRTDLIDPQILTDTVRGRLATKSVINGSVLGGAGAILMSGSMPGGPDALGNTITMPYFGMLPEFETLAETSSATPKTLGQTSETATIARKSLAFEVTKWARGTAAATDGSVDPYVEAADQVEMRLGQAIDQAMIDACKGTPLVRDISSASNKFVSWQDIIRTRTLFGDEQDATVGIAVHSRTLNDMALLSTSDGKPLLLENASLGQMSIMRFAGVPVVVSDRVPLDASSMGTVTSTGSTPPVVTLAVADASNFGPWDLVIDCVVGGAHATATYRFSTDGGNTWSATLTTPTATTVVALEDTAEDSLVGRNGKTGLTIAFAAGTFNADNQWTATADITTDTMIFQRGAGAFWFNAMLLELLTDTDILKHSDIAAMHLYYAAHRYRRRAMGTRPGVARLRHKVRDYTG